MSNGKTVDEVLNDIKAQALDVMEQGCTMLEADTKLNCPVGHYPPSSGRKGGTLKRSITHEVSQNGDSIVGAVGSNVEYAPYVEWRKHFFSATIDKDQGQIESMFEKLGGDSK